LTVVAQEFKAHVFGESYVILGNDALLKCEIPSFVADLVYIVGWTDSLGSEFAPGLSSNGKTLQFACIRIKANKHSNPHHRE